MSTPDGGGYITKQAFVNMSGNSLPSSVQTSNNSLSSATPTDQRSIENVNTSNTSKTTTNRNSVISNKPYSKEFDLNDKRLSITLSCHSTDSSNGGNSGNNSNKSSNEDISESKKKSKKNSDDDGSEEHHHSKDESKGTKKFGLKHFKNTLSKTFSKASFRKFSISHKKTMTGNCPDAINEKQDFEFATKEEQEEFNDFVNNLNTKKVSSKHRPSLNGLFLNPDANSQSSKPPNNDGLPPLQPQPRKKSIENSKYELALSHLCEVLDYEEPMVLAKYLKAANGDENLALKNYLKDSKNNNSTVKHHETEDKEGPLELNEMNNIERNDVRQDPVIKDRKGRRVK